MERLTEHIENNRYNLKDLDKGALKLMQFEDFMEEQGFEDLQSLKNTLYQTNMELYSMIKLRKENQALKDRWQKLKEHIITLINESKDKFDSRGISLMLLIDKMEEIEKEIN